jgi:hypothetical protein
MLLFVVKNYCWHCLDFLVHRPFVLKSSNIPRQLHQLFYQHTAAKTLPEKRITNSHGIIGQYTNFTLVTSTHPHVQRQTTSKQQWQFALTMTFFKLASNSATPRITSCNKEMPRGDDRAALAKCVRSRARNLWLDMSQIVVKKRHILIRVDLDVALSMDAKMPSNIPFGRLGSTGSIAVVTTSYVYWGGMTCANANTTRAAKLRMVGLLENRQANNGLKQEYTAGCFR